MTIHRCICPILLSFVGLLQTTNLVVAQVYYEVAPRHTVYSSPVYSHPATVVHHPAPIQQSPAPARNIFDACDCHRPTGECTCNHSLHCEITLPGNCKSTRERPLVPITVKVLGTIPKLVYTEDCYEREVQFNAETKVPEIHCATKTCIKIGTKTFECVPGCTFSLCIPTAQCEEETVECKLVPRMMQMAAKIRRDGTVDVYVINNSDTTAPNHAGGMPEQWIVMHCATKEQVRSKFPSATRPDGSPISSTIRSSESLDTTADVNIEVVIRKSTKDVDVDATTSDAEDSVASESTLNAKS